MCEIFKRALHSFKCLFFDDNYFHIQQPLIIRRNYGNKIKAPAAWE
jgi:hypothetical protein